MAAAISFPMYVLMSITTVAALPMFAAVDHAMGVWGSRYNGRLPCAQIAVLVLVATVLQCMWLFALPFFPFSVLGYYLWLRVRILGWR